MANLNKRLIDFAQAVSEKLVNVLNKIKELEQTIQTIRGIKGDKGDTGPQGPVGEQGPAGRDGTAGPAGSDGRNGYTFTPSLSSAGILSWTNDGNLPNPSSINIKGPKGDIGPRGHTGPQGPVGEQGPIGPRGPAGYEGEISDSYNGNRRNVPVSEYAVGLLHSKMEQLKETKQVWVGNVTQHSTSILELSESILNKTLIFYLQHSQSNSLTQNANVHTASLYVDKELMSVTGRKYCHTGLYIRGWLNCQIELVSENKIRIIDISSMYLKKITAV